MLYDSSKTPGMVLLKMGEQDHMKQFRSGRLYMNTLDYFRGLAGDPARADRFEGASRIFQPKDIIMTLSVPGLGEVVIGEKDLAAATTLSMQTERSCNLFCLYAITQPVNGRLFPSEHEWFGNSIVLVLSTQEFINRVSVACMANKLKGESGFVEYYDDETYTGRLDRFKKRKRFAHQREYRIAVESPGTEPLLLEIGDITDITSEVLPFSDADSMLKFSEDDARAAGLTW